MSTSTENKLADPAANASSGDPSSVVKHRKQLLGAVDFSTWGVRLQRFFEQLPGVAGPVEISDLTLPGAGGSSGTLLFTARYTADQGRVTRPCVLRYATEGGLFHSYNLPGQYAILLALQGSAVAVPGLVGLDADGSVLGVVGFVMDRVDGETAPPSYFSSGLLVESTPELRRGMVRDVLTQLARLHTVDAEQAAFDFLRQRGQGRTAVERDIDWYWSALQWGCPAEVAELAPLRQWLIDHQPPEDRIVLNHGDSTLANYMFRAGRVMAVLDWELAFLGHPANDIAFQVLANAFIGMGSAGLPGLPTEAEWKAEYEQVSGTALTHWPYFLALAAFKLHLILLLVYRDVTPEMASASQAVKAYGRHSLNQRIATAEAAGAHPI